MKSHSVWDLIELGAVVRVATGLVSPDDPAIAEKVHVGPEHIRSGGGIIYSKLRTVAESGLISGKYAFDAEAVLYSKIRPNLNKVAIADFDGVCSADIYPIWPDERILDKGFLYAVLTSERFVERAISRSFRTGIPKINREDLLSIRIDLPPLPEQLKIAEILRTWDDAVDGLEQFKKLQSARREAMISKLLFGDSEPHGTTWTLTTPGWTIRPIGDIAKEAGSRNTALSAEAVLTCSKHLGFVRSDDYFRRTVHSADLSNYKLVYRGEFAFPSNHVEEGSIGLQNVVDTGVVSPIYTVFAFNRELVEPRFAYLVLKSQQYTHMFRVSTSATVDRRGSLRWPEFSKLPFPVPPMHTQKRIVQIAQDFDEDLARSTKLTALYRDQKRGLMQKLLTGEIRVTGDSSASTGEASDE